MRNWDPLDEVGDGVCSVVEDAKAAETACKQLNIPLKHVDFVKEYWSSVFEPFLEGYAKVIVALTAVGRGGGGWRKVGCLLLVFVLGHFIGSHS